MMKAQTIMIQGTGSHVGKSIITAGLCRMLRQDGFKVAPFKSQNMSNNSYVTWEGGEIGRAQAVQAEAAGIIPTVDMNPILLKPASDIGAQVVLHGRPYKTMGAREYQFHTLSLLPQVRESLDRLRSQFDVIVMEGAGSPAEINLQAYDIANMRIAEMADAPVILVGDIDRGGVFASFVGTLELIPPAERRRIKAFLINKFRGDVSLLQPGLDFLKTRTGIPTLGVIPFFHHLDLLEEDGLSEDRIRRNRVYKDPQKILIDVVWFPRISNFTDFAPLDSEPDVLLTYLRQVPDRLPDVLILPGTKSTMADLQFLRDAGFELWIQHCVDRGVMVIGICGGYQMLGKQIADPYAMESVHKEITGLGYLPVETIFDTTKMTKQVCAIHLESKEKVSGYEIHMGRTAQLLPTDPVFEITEYGKAEVRLQEGCSVQGGQIWGTYLHGIFDGDGFRRYFLNALRQRKGLKRGPDPVGMGHQQVYDQLADLIRKNMNTDLFYEILSRESAKVEK